MWKIFGKNMGKIQDGWEGKEGRKEKSLKGRGIIRP
jgi:hypothetical protein